jgi:hypothetical protein
VVQIVQTSCSQSQNLYILLSSLLEKLQDTEKGFSAYAKFTIVSCIAQLIIQGGAVITLANLELLEVFVTQLQTKLDSSDEKLQRDYNHLLISSSGNLALSLSYPNQLNDLINFLAKQLNQSNNIIPILECINALLYTRNSPFFRKKTLSRRESSIIVHSPISYEVLRPCLNYYSNESQGLPFKLTLTDIRFLVFTILEKALKLDVSHAQ